MTLRAGKTKHNLAPGKFFFLVIKNFIENGPEKVVNPGIVSGKEIRELHWAHSLFYPPARKMMKTNSWFG